MTGEAMYQLTEAAAGTARNLCGSMRLRRMYVKYAIASEGISAAEVRGRFCLKRMFRAGRIIAAIEAEYFAAACRIAAGCEANI
jgi:hypothetical protein